MVTIRIGDKSWTIEGDRDTVVLELMAGRNYSAKKADDSSTVVVVTPALTCAEFTDGDGTVDPGKTVF